MTSEPKKKFYLDDPHLIILGKTYEFDVLDKDYGRPQAVADLLERKYLTQNPDGKGYVLTAKGKKAINAE